MIEFIFMLTHDDVTVDNALAAYEEVRGTDLRYIGFKDIGASQSQLTEITRRAHEDGREVMLEVVSTSAQAERRSIRMAPDIGVDWVLGGTHITQALPELAGSAIRYCPFPGHVTGHPSVLTGDIAEIAGSARTLTAMPGVHGLDLLTYRHPSADPEALTTAVAAASAGPVIAAGESRRRTRSACSRAAVPGPSPSAARSSKGCFRAAHPSTAKSGRSCRLRVTAGPRANSGSRDR